MTDTLEAAISRTADDLHRAAERLTDLQARVRDAETRAAEAETQVREAQARTTAALAETEGMEDLVVAARSEAEEARSELAAAEAASLSARAEAEAAEAEAREARARLAELEEESKDAIARLASLEDEAREARARAQDVDAKADGLQTHARELENRSAELEARTKELEAEIDDLGAAKLEAEARLGELRAHVEELEAAKLEAQARAAATEEQLALDASRNIDLLNVLEQAREARTEAEERARHAEERLEIAMERARLLEEEMTELRGRVEEAERQPTFTVILDDERTALQEAVAAEARRPLTSILGITLALKHTDPSSGEGKDMVRQLGTHARKLDRLIGQMLEIDRIATGTFEPNVRRTDVEALVRRVTDESPDLEDREVKLDTQHAAVTVDPAITEQIVEVLLSNAGRRTVPGTTVWVRVTPEDAGATIAVDDTGPEVPPGLRQAMFEAAAHENGSGPSHPSRPKAATGLSLLSRLAGVHGGRCWVEERPGGGASFRVFLPDVAATSPQEPGESAREQRVAASDDGGSTPPASSSLIAALREAMKDDA